jgi:hypothetical protein
MTLTYLSKVPMTLADYYARIGWELSEEQDGEELGVLVDRGNSTYEWHTLADFTTLS